MNETNKRRMKMEKRPEKEKEQTKDVGKQYLVLVTKGGLAVRVWIDGILNLKEDDFVVKAELRNNGDALYVEDNDDRSEEGV